MIPKIIHYVWVGDKQKPESVLKCIESWQKYCPDYQIKEWGNEVLKQIDNAYVKEAFEAKKWAFVSDYIRLYALQKYGGVYLDTDTELTAPIDQFLKHDFVISYENYKDQININAAFIASVPNHKIVSDMLSIYKNLKFKLKNGDLDMTTIPKRFYRYFEKEFQFKDTSYGTKETYLDPKSIIYPWWFFCTPQEGKKSYAIHHYDGSWLDEYRRKNIFSFLSYRFVKFKKNTNKNTNLPLQSNEKIKFIFRVSSRKKYALIKNISDVKESLMQKIKNKISKEPDFPIDLVYLWCDGNDSAFKERKAQALKEAKKVNKQATNGRFYQVDELKYSLRSVEQYIPWIHHIYVVTDRQIPKWLNLSNSKISVIDHSQILSQDSIPTFNAYAIESCIYKIPELTEHFLYANDDFFVGRKIKPSFFFTKSGKIIFRYKKETLNPQKSIYDQNLFLAQQKIEQLFNIFYDCVPHHNIDSYLKSDYINTAQIFKQDFQKTEHSVFREFNNISRLIVNLYSAAKGNAVLKKVNLTRWQRMLRGTLFCRVDSYYMANYGRLYKIKKHHPALFCINDTEYSDMQHRKNAKQYLEKRFPNKSSFEK